HGVEIETIEAPPVSGRDLRAVARDADPLEQSLLTREQGGVERPSRAECLVPLDRVREGMDLPEVDMVHVETVEGPFDLFARAFLVPPVAFRGEKEMPGLPLEPWCDA